MKFCLFALFGILALLPLSLVAFEQTAPTSDKSSPMPDSFIGRFEQKLPDMPGETYTDSWTCEAEVGCQEQMEGTKTSIKFSPVTLASYQVTVKARQWLAYAKAHKDEPEYTETEWEMKSLRPLLNSKADINQCINLPSAPPFPNSSPLPEGARIICDLNQNPWNKPAVLMANRMMNYSGSYDFSVLFRNTDMPQNHIPPELIGTFSEKIPKVIGGMVPEITSSIECRLIEGCIQQMEGTPAFHYLNGIKTSSDEVIANARRSLIYAKKHVSDPQGPTTAWQAKALAPLLTSDADINSCINLEIPNQPEMKDIAVVILCTLSHDPWQRPVVLMMNMLMNNSGRNSLFESYEISAFFRTP